MGYSGRIRSAQAALESREIGYYPLFDSAVEDKRVAIWQPNSRVDDLYELPNPADDMEQKAGEFLGLAVEEEAHLALAPEWAYNIDWVSRHRESLFAADSPLFVLGCAPVETETMESLIEDLKENDFHCIPEAVPEGRSTEFVTPTIIPIRTRPDDGEPDIKDVLLIQYKNAPMGDGANPNEELYLEEGEFVWNIDPDDYRTELLTLTCSDILDPDLRYKAQEFARGTDCFVAHVQCNPKPFHDIWLRFRREIFGADNDRVTYVAANWARVRSDREDVTGRYSGVYTLAPERTPLEHYDQTYSNGGLPGTKPNEKCEFVWMLPEMDTVSLAEFKRKDPAGEGATGPSFANPLLSQTWIWEEGEYIENAPGVPECEEDECDEWRDLLPDAPRDIELISSIGLGRVSVSDINDVDVFIPQKHIDWSSLDNLRTGNSEEVCHTLAKHPNRRDPSPEEISSTLNIAFSLAREAEDIVPVDEVDMDELPVNATYSDHDSGVPISLTVIKTPSETQWRERIRWINDWYRLQQAEDDDSQRPPFKPVTARMNSTGEYKIKQLPEYEKVDGGPPKPEQVDPTGGIGGGEL